MGPGAAYRDTGFRGISGRLGSAEWWAGVCFVVPLLTGVLGPITALLGVDPVSFLTTPTVQWIGAVTAVAGIVATFVAQLEMGSNWRIGVDEFGAHGPGHERLTPPRRRRTSPHH